MGKNRASVRVLVYGCLYFSTEEWRSGQRGAPPVEALAPGLPQTLRARPAETVLCGTAQPGAGRLLILAPATSTDCSRWQGRGRAQAALVRKARDGQFPKAAATHRHGLEGPTPQAPPGSSSAARPLGRCGAEPGRAPGTRWDAGVSSTRGWMGSEFPSASRPRPPGRQDRHPEAARWPFLQPRPEPAIPGALV